MKHLKIRAYSLAYRKTVNELAAYASRLDLLFVFLVLLFILIVTGLVLLNFFLIFLLKELLLHLNWQLLIVLILLLVLF